MRSMVFTVGTVAVLVMTSPADAQRRSSELSISRGEFAVAPFGGYLLSQRFIDGPLGTSLNVTKNGEKYKVEIKNLDGTQTFDGAAVGDTVQFTRKGKLETIKAATAEETGMKWLQGEKNCVVITKRSEGYCRK